MMKKLKINDVAKDLHLTTQELIAFYEPAAQTDRRKNPAAA